MPASRPPVDMDTWPLMSWPGISCRDYSKATLTHKPVRVETARCVQNNGSQGLGGYFEGRQGQKSQPLFLDYLQLVCCGVSAYDLYSVLSLFQPVLSPS